MSRKTDVESLRRQLAQAEANLELIRERKAQYVLEVDVPLQLIREERRLLTLIAQLKELPKEKAEEILEEARVLLKKDSLDEAIKLLRSVRSGHPNNKDVERLYLEAIYCKGTHLYVKEYNLHQARHAFQEVVVIDPYYEDAARLLREVEQRLERVPLAIRLLGQVREALRDPVWQGIGAIVAIIALLLSVGPIVYRQVIVPETPTRVATVTPIHIGKVVTEIDGRDASDRCQEIICNSSPRIQVTVLDSEGVPLRSDIFSYNWRFNPPDSHNLDKLDSKNYAVIYFVPCEHENQAVTIEVLRDGETLCVRTICFTIKKRP